MFDLVILIFDLVILINDAVVFARRLRTVGGHC
jgi:hypothetical protein